MAVIDAANILEDVTYTVVDQAYTGYDMLCITC